VNNFFLFKFDSEEECREDRGCVDGRLIILKKWTQNIDFDRDLLSSVPVWVRFLSFHLKFWSKSTLSKHVSVIGVPCYLDKAAVNRAKLSYAKILLN